MHLRNRSGSSLLQLRQDGLLRWLARLAAKRTVSLALIAAILIVDLVIPWTGLSQLPRWQGLSFVPRALVDEPCAVATALVVLGAITRFRGTPPSPKFGWSLLAWSVLIDVDHLPHEFGTSILTADTPRPYPHALWVVLVLIVATAVAHYWSRTAKTSASAATVQILAGAAWGISAHFFRDVATAPISLWWPVTKAPVHEPYWGYVLELLIIVAMLPMRARTSIAKDEQSSENIVALSEERT